MWISDQLRNERRHNTVGAKWSDMSRELQLCFAISQSEGFPPVKRSSPIHSFAIQDILGLGEKNSKPKPSSQEHATRLAECFASVSSQLENPISDENETVLQG